MTARFAVFVLALGGLAPAVFSQQKPRTDIVRKSPDATVPLVFRRAILSYDKLKYSGTRTVELRRGADRISHVEYIVHQGLRTRVWFPADSAFAGQVIVETERARWHYYPKSNIIEVLPPKSEEGFLRLRQWIQHPGGAIRLSTEKGENVAGRATVIGLVSDGKGNVRQRLWIDEGNGMILKREVLDAVGDPAASFEYTQVDLNPVILPSDFAINVRGARIVTLQDKLRGLCNRNRMLLVSIPESTGFQLQGVNMMKVIGLPVLHQAYTGKRGQLSLFEVSGNISLEGLKRQNQRGFELYGWQMGGHSFALVGSYPLDELKELAQILGQR